MWRKNSRPRAKEKQRRAKILNEDKIVEYILVNKELNMGVEKIAGQVAHVQTIIDNKIRHYADCDKDPSISSLTVEDALKWYEQWFSKGPQTKIILQAKEKDLLKAIGMGAVEVRDKGLTEIPPNSLTAVGFVPQPKSNLVSFTKKFQLL